VHALDAGKKFVKGDGLLASEVTIRGESCDQAMLNNGTFGAQYDAQVGNVELVESGRVDGKFAGNFTESSRFAIYGVGPYSGGEMVSFSLWFKTNDSTNEMIMFHYGSSGGAEGSKDHLTVTLAKGVPVVYFRPECQLEPNGDGADLADGEWHQIALSMPKKSVQMAGFRMYIDGERVKTSMRNGKSENVFFTTRGNLSLGGFGYQGNSFDEYYPFMTTFNGLMDDFRVVARPFAIKYFDTYNGNECSKDDESTYELFEMNRFGQCQRNCKRNKSCQGYELNKGNKTCYHFNEHPSIVPSNEENVRCALKETTFE
jgi:hypothetical protein